MAVVLLLGSHLLDEEGSGHGADGLVQTVSAHVARQMCGGGGAKCLQQTSERQRERERDGRYPVGARAQG